MTIEVECADNEMSMPLLLESFETADEAFLDGFFVQLSRAHVTSDDSNTPRLDFALSIVKGVAPRDEFEAMLAAQMAAIHAARLLMARRSRHANVIDGGQAVAGKVAHGGGGCEMGEPTQESI